MAVDPEIGRVNVLLEYLAECSGTNDLAAFIHVAGGRVRWVLDFERFTLVIRSPSDCQYWTVSRDAEHLESIAPDALPPTDKEMISTVLLQGIPLASTLPIHGLCLPLQTMDLQVGAICFTNDRGHYSYRDERFVHQIAQFFSGTIVRLLQAETIRRQASDLESAIRAKDEFLAILGHELRNPLAPILLSVELLDRRLGDQAPRELAVIKRQAQHLVRLVDDLLDVARVTRGSLELVSSPVETSTVVARAIEMASPLIEARRHRLEVDVPSKGLCIDGDESRLAQVIANLLTNAARYTDPGGLIQIVAQRSEEQVVIEVSDNGCGISSDFLPRIFSMFVQAGEARGDSRAGLGLGLAIVKSLTQLHGGSVSVSSGGPGRGSTFTVRLPRLAQTPDRQVVAPFTRAAALSAHPRRVMVVDDNDDLAASLGDVLENAGHHVIVLHDGVAALDRLNDIQPEVALLDIGLPVIDGYHLAREIRARLGVSTPFLIALTGYGQSGDAQRSRDAGFDAHFVKPVDLRQLLRAVESASKTAGAMEVDVTSS
jgi:signal transduction histidine kinase/ActR/RegA family two-component response regulator